MKTPILCLAVLAATPAAAQPLAGTAPSPSYTAGWQGQARALESDASLTLGGRDETPTTRRQKYVWAIALRDEAAALLAADGGTLSAKNQRYIRNKASRILGYER